MKVAILALLGNISAIQLAGPNSMVQGEPTPTWKEHNGCKENEREAADGTCVFEG